MSSDKVPITFHAPTKLVVGANSLAQLPQLAGSLGRRALLVSDPQVTRALKLTTKLQTSLEAAGVKTAVFDQIEPNPSVETVSKGAEVARKHQADLLVGLGGGSVLDAAKGIAIVSQHGGEIWDYIGGDRVPGPVAKMIAIPTTSGTGSETTPFGVYTKRGSRRKDGLYSPHIFPAVAILDPVVTSSLPSALTAETGLDALAHAIEAYTSRNAQQLPDVWAEQAMQLIAQHLMTAVENGTNLEARESMALASALAGWSITHSGVGAAHGFGMSIGGLYNQPHGRTIGLLLPAVMAYNRSALPLKFERIASIFKAASPNLFGDLSDPSIMVARLLQKTRSPARLSELGVRRDQLEEILDDCLERGDFSNNPRPFNRETAREFLESIL